MRPQIGGSDLRWLYQVGKEVPPVEQNALALVKKNTKHIKSKSQVCISILHHTHPS